MRWNRRQLAGSTLGRYSTPEPCSTLRFQGPDVRRVLLVALLAGLTLCFAASSAQAYVYWTNEFSGMIGRANLDGSSPNNNFITGLAGLRGIAVDHAHIYWVNSSVGGGAIGRANLDGSSANPNFITGLGDPCGIALPCKRNGRAHYVPKGR